jgi:hypothetical protein
MYVFRMCLLFLRIGSVLSYVYPCLVISTAWTANSNDKSLLKLIPEGWPLLEFL